MKAFISFLLLAFIFFQGSAQPFDTLRRKDPGNREFIQVRKGANIHAEGYVENGLTEGVWTQYWENGYPISMITFRKGKMDGLKVNYNAQGMIEVMENYRDDLLEGPKRAYRSGTQFLSEEIYFIEGKMHGSYHKRYPSGKPQETSNYNMGLRDGKATWYYENGEKAVEYQYRNGKIQGEAATYHANGRVNEVGLYKDNEQTGYWKEFYENGQMKAEGVYENGKKHGPWKEYDENGALLRTVKYNKGTKK